MIHLKNERTVDVKHNLRGGNGDPVFLHAFSKEELGGKADVLATVTLQPGESIGEHPHVDNGEVYLILSGSATVTEDGVPHTLTVGDAEYCGDGHTHSIANHTAEPVTFLAFIAGNR